MKHTENFKLRLPDEEDIYNVEDFNFNTETIDEEIGNLNTDIKAMKELGFNTLRKHIKREPARF